MKTSRMISTISYNSPAFLLMKLQDLTDSYAVAFWAYVKHTGEDVLDEETGEVIGRDKDHIHLFIEPNKALDTMKLQKMLEEPIPSSNKPLKCMPFQPSKRDEWILYNSHDVGYLRTKCETKQYTYNFDAFITSDNDAFTQYWYEAFHSSVYAQNKAKLKLMTDNPADTATLIASGVIPIAMSCQAMAFKRLTEEAHGLILQRRNYEELADKYARALDDMPCAPMEHNFALENGYIPADTEECNELPIDGKKA